jgi:hypothetical protein
VKILVSNYTHPTISNYSTILFKNVLPILQKRIDTQIIWAIHNDYSSKIDEMNENKIVLKISNFQNAVDMLNFVKPDLIFIMPGLSALDYAFYLAAKFLKIKIIGGQISGPFFSPVGKNNRFRTYFSQSIQKTTIIKNNGKEEKILKSQGLWKKYVFLFNTMKSVNMISYKIIHEFLEFILAHVSWRYLAKFISKLKCDAIFVDSEKELNKKVQEGYEKKSLVITGNPSYDKAIKKINEIKTKENNDKKIKVLFLTVNLENQGGNWTRKKRDFMLREFFKFCSSEDFICSIKIHPTSENLDEYKNIIASIDSKIPIFQKQDLVDCLNDIDVVISMSSSTAGLISLILKKPMIIWNYFNVKNDLFLDNEVVLECKNIEKLSDYIKYVLEVNPASKEKLQSVVSNISHKTDGKASERIADEILKLIKK